jgi:hypothetical protein
VAPSDENSGGKVVSSSPKELAEWLTVWALRREKVMHLIDRKAAQRARAYADRCLELSRQMSFLPDDERRQRWQSLKLEVSGFLAERRSSGLMHAVVAPSDRPLGPSSEVRESLSPPPRTTFPPAREGEPTSSDRRPSDPALSGSPDSLRRTTRR